MKLSADRLQILRERVLLFEGFSDENILTLLDYSQRRGLVDGEVLVEEGEQSQSMFILISGQAAVVRDHHDGPEILAQLEPGATIGEMAMLDTAPRSARVVARGDGVALIFDASLLDRAPDHIRSKLYRNLSIILVRRLRLANRRMESLATKSAVGIELDNLRNLDLSGINLANIRGKRMDLSGADLRGASLKDADLRGADLSGARMDGAHLQNVDVSRARTRDDMPVVRPSSEIYESGTEHHWESLMKSLAKRAKKDE